MILYLVKWEDGTAALVNALDEEHLFEVLDELGSPTAASWEEYDGPLWLEFERVDYGLPPGDVDPHEAGTLKVAIAPTDTGGEFTDMLLGKLHPGFRKLRDQAVEADRSIPRADFDRAVKDDLVWALPRSTMGPSGQGEEN